MQDPLPARLPEPARQIRSRGALAGGPPARQARRRPGPGLADLVPGLRARRLTTLNPGTLNDRFWRATHAASRAPSRARGEADRIRWMADASPVRGSRSPSTTPCATPWASSTCRTSASSEWWGMREAGRSRRPSRPMSWRWSLVRPSYALVLTDEGGSDRRRLRLPDRGRGVAGRAERRERPSRSERHRCERVRARRRMGPVGDPRHPGPGLVRALRQGLPGDRGDWI